MPGVGDTVCWLVPHTTHQGVEMQRMVWGRVTSNVYGAIIATEINAGEVIPAIWLLEPGKIVSTIKRRP